MLQTCAIPVNCPNNKVEELAYVFYTTYVKEKGIVRNYPFYISDLTEEFLLVDSCKINGTLEITSNENDLTQPKNIFYIELVLLLLNLSLMGAALLLPKMQTEVGKSTKIII